MSNEPLLTEDEAAKLLRVTKRTLRGMRAKGGGPKFIRLPRKIVYSRVHLDAWIEEEAK